MTDSLLLILIGGGFTVGIWFSYRLFMRGDTDVERVARHLPPEFKPEWSFRHGDTYVGYERSSDRLAIVDYPYGTVVKPRDIAALEPVDEGAWGIVHRWVSVAIPNQPRKYRLWFGLSSARRDQTLSKLREIVAGK